MTLQIDEDLLGALYPAFIRTDPEGRLTSVGPAIVRHVTGAAGGRSWDDLFQHVGPGVSPLEQVGQWVHVRIAARESAVELSGAVVRETQGLTYLLSPSLQDRSQPSALQLDDFPPGDAGVANMITISLQRALIEESQTLVEELAEARAEAESALQTQTDFLNGVSHALRTPLASLVLYADLLDSREDSDAQALTGRFRDAVLDLKAKLDNLIDFSALRAGRVRAAPHWCEAARLVAGLSPLKHLADRRGVAFACDLGDLAGKQVYVDAALLDQLLQSLVQNAIEIAGGGRVSVQFVGGPARVLRVEVRHTGGPLAPASRGSMLGDLGSARTLPQQGGEELGLGFAVSREIVRVLDGAIGDERIDAESSLVWFEIPAEAR